MSDPSLFRQRSFWKIAATPSGEHKKRVGVALLGTRGAQTNILIAAIRFGCSHLQQTSVDAEESQCGIAGILRMVHRKLYPWWIEYFQGCITATENRSFLNCSHCNIFYFLTHFVAIHISIAVPFSS